MSLRSLRAAAPRRRWSSRSWPCSSRSAAPAGRPCGCRPTAWGTAQLQNFSVGNAKLRPNSVGSAKIIPGAVGAAAGGLVPSAAAGHELRALIGAIQSIAVSGNVTCTPVAAERGRGLPRGSTLGTAQKQVASVALPANPGGSSYLAIGNVQITEVEGTAPQSVDVSCTMTVGSGSGPGGGSPTTGHFDANLGGANATAASGAIPLVLPVSVAGSPQTLAIACGDLAAPASPAPTRERHRDDQRRSRP